MPEAARAVELWRHTGERLRSRGTAEVTSDGTFVVEGQDLGEVVEEWWGDTDYEYDIRVKPEWKDTLLLRLIQDRFRCSEPLNIFRELREWLEQQGIPYEFWNWA